MYSGGLYRNNTRSPGYSCLQGNQKADSVLKKREGVLQSPVGKFELLTVVNNIHTSASVDISGYKTDAIIKYLKYLKISAFICCINIDTRITRYAEYVYNLFTTKEGKYEESFKDWLSCSDNGAVVRL